MGVSEFVLLATMILVGFLFFLIAQSFISQWSIETKRAAYRAEAERLVSFIQKVASEPSDYFSLYLPISPCNLSVEKGVLTYQKDGVKLSFLVPVKDANLTQVSSVCIIKSKGNITLLEKCPACNFDSICTPDECLQDCVDCYGPNPACIGDEYCNRKIGESCENSIDCVCSRGVCCPRSPDADENGCSTTFNLKIGSECWCSSQCSEGLNCNPTTGNVSYKYACCPDGKSWNGSDCIIAKADVLIISLKSKLLEVYSENEIRKIEKKINEFMHVLAEEDLNSIFLYLDGKEVNSLIGFNVTDPDSWRNIDGVLDVLIPTLNAKYLIIIGGHRIIPQRRVGSFRTDDDYGDFNPKDGLPEIPVGRIPDPISGDVDVILNAFDTFIKLHKEGGIDLRNYVFIVTTQFGDLDGVEVFRAVFGKPCIPAKSCYTCAGASTISGRDFLYLLDHGSPGAPQKINWGACFSLTSTQLPIYDVSDMVFTTAACFGGKIDNKRRTEDSIVMQHLKYGGSIYMGGTSPQWVGFIGKFYIQVFKRFSEGKRIGDAFLEGKKGYKFSLGGSSRGYITWHQTLLYGDPTLKIKNMW